MNDWFRSWHGAPTDNKWLVIAHRAKVAPGMVSAIAWALFDHASQCNDRGSVVGFDVETYAIFSGFEEAQVTAVLGAMRDKGVIMDGRLAAWDSRQPRREDLSTSRTAAYRERKRAAENAARGDVVPANAGERPGTQANAGERSETHGNAGEREGTPDKRRGEEIQNGSVSSGSYEPTDTAAPSGDLLAAPGVFDPAEQPEEWFWSRAGALEERGVPRSQLGALKSLHGGNWKTLVPAMQGILRAKDPPSYLNKLVASLRATQAAAKPPPSARQPRNALPDFVASAMREGLRVEIGKRKNGEPKYQIANTIYDMRGQEIGF